MHILISLIVILSICCVAIRIWDMWVNKPVSENDVTSTDEDEDDLLRLKQTQLDELTKSNEVLHQEIGLTHSLIDTTKHSRIARNRLRKLNMELEDDDDSLEIELEDDSFDSSSDSSSDSFDSSSDSFDSSSDSSFD